MHNGHTTLQMAKHLLKYLAISSCSLIPYFNSEYIKVNTYYMKYSTAYGIPFTLPVILDTGEGVRFSCLLSVVAASSSVVASLS